MDHRVDYDGPPIELRAKRRMQARYFSRNADTADAVDGGHAIEVGAEPRDPDLAHEGDAGVFDDVPAEVAPEHVILSRKLVKQFQIRYERNEVKWLKFPDKAMWRNWFPNVPFVEPANV